MASILGWSHFLSLSRYMEWETKEFAKAKSKTTHILKRHHQMVHFLEIFFILKQAPFQQISLQNQSVICKISFSYHSSVKNSLSTFLFSQKPIFELKIPAKISLSNPLSLITTKALDPKLLLQKPHNVNYKCIPLSGHIFHLWEDNADILSKRGRGSCLCHPSKMENKIIKSHLH